MTITRIILIEDHDLTRIGLRTALKRIQGIEIVGEAATAMQGLELLKSTHPDIAVVDIGLPDIDGIELTRQIKQLQASSDQSPTKILILTMHENEELVLAAFAAGADSYCMKDIRIERLVEAIKTTDEGNSWIDPMIANIVLQKVRQAASPIHDRTKTIAIDSVQPEMEQMLGETPLTERELEILQLIVDGCSNAAIAEKLFISVGTVKTHVRNILNKLCADDRTQAAVLALRSGLIS
ncbi:response regulator containing a CheY-like receiver domain and an HTH DNA-binding domain [Leptolyngbyaceae cyanobacterium JSC-12]|nr:response regulator containing a CheY-like receiver domain and an HTH DNA-binding domain [Leptolyngbyaceae cyanobacterium JSC-12]